MLKILVTIFCVLFLGSCQFIHQQRLPKLAKKQNQLEPYHEKFFWNDYDAILKSSAKAFYLKNHKHIFYMSYINYKKLSSKKTFRKIIQSQLTKLASTQIPSETQSQIAFWINTYNFLVISEIVNNYPIPNNKSIRFKSTRHIVAGKHYSLNEIYKVLLSYKDPRILFALNSGQVAGPSIKFKSFSGINLDTDLKRQVSNNLLNPIIVSSEINIFNESQLDLNDVFKSFEEAFKGIKLEDFLRENLDSSLEKFQKVKIIKNIYEGINSKRETKRLIKDLNLNLESV
jgi:hypothetical protein